MSTSRLHSDVSTSAGSGIYTSAEKSEHLLERACQSLAGGDSSTMRVVPYHLPLVAQRGKGARVWDADGNEYIDMNMAYGPLLFGHCPEGIVKSVVGQITQRGSQLGFPTEISMRVAEKLKRLFPSMELLRFANSGTEAMASSVRLARGYTGRSKIILFEGHYHGWSEAVFHKYHAPLAELPMRGYGPAIPGTQGMTGALDDAIVVRWNDLDLLEHVLDRYQGMVAAVVMEPVMGNAGVIAPEPGYLEGVRMLTRAHESLLIFDEVISGLRVGAGRAQGHYNVRPDITAVSKALGGGYPVAAFGASREIMDTILSGRVFHGGVYSGNATVMAAAEALLDEILTNKDSIYQHLYAKGDQLAHGIRDVLNGLDIPNVVQNVGPMLTFFLTDGEADRITDYRAARQHCDFDAYIRLQHQLQQTGVYYHPNQFEPLYLSTAHTDADIATVIDRLEAGARCVYGL